jgi:hypothetical protein
MSQQDYFSKEEEFFQLLANFTKNKPETLSKDC